MQTTYLKSILPQKTNYHLINLQLTCHSCLARKYIIQYFELKVNHSQRRQKISIPTNTQPKKNPKRNQKKGRNDTIMIWLCALKDVPTSTDAHGPQTNMHQVAWFGKWDGRWKTATYGTVGDSWLISQCHIGNIS